MSVGAQGELETLIETDFEEFYSEVLPDRRWIAYHSIETGAWEVYVRPFPNVDDGRWQISRGGGISPRWGPDGHELFYRSGAMMAVEVQTEPNFSPGVPQVLFSISGQEYLGGLPTRSRPWDVAEVVDSS